jgi:hypothetical protein
MSTFDEFEVEVDDDPEGTDRSYGAREKGLHKLNLEYKNPPRKEKLGTWWKKHSDKIILAIGIILIAGISFEAGFLKGQKNQKDPITINQVACAPCPEKLTNENESKTNTGTNSEKPASAENKKCAFVASKNSDKYHLPTCQWAEKIKAENRVCFSSANEAQSRGYQPAKCCIK